MLPLFRHVRVRSWEFINVFKWELRVFCMKALSLKQPFAELILQGKKVIELRKWNTRFRGEFLIHASKVSDVDAMKRFGFSELPAGKIVGKAFLKDVKKYESEEDFLKDNDKHLASREWGNFFNSRYIRQDKTIISPFARSQMLIIVFQKILFAFIFFYVLQKCFSNNFTGGQFRKTKPFHRIHVRNLRSMNQKFSSEPCVPFS